MKLKRSTIDNSIDVAKQVIRHFNLQLPYFAFWTPKDWEKAGEEFNEVRDCMLGWDVTDFGMGDFTKIGRVLLTLRNGRKGTAYRKEYAEKLLIDPEGQRAPAHFHRTKREDLICRDGGNILVQLSKTDEQGGRSNKPFTIQVDGRNVKMQPDEIIRLYPGMSICIPPGTIHQFWGEEGTGYRIDGVGYTLSNEISSVCDDWNDNVFVDVAGVRFPEIEEDVARRYYLCHEYPKASAEIVS